MYKTIQLFVIVPIPPPWDAPGVRIVKSTIVVTPIISCNASTRLRPISMKWAAGWVATTDPSQAFPHYVAALKHPSR